MEVDEYLDAIRRRAGAAAAAARTSLDAPVPSCPEWTVRDLIGHLGGVYGWCASIVSTGTRGAFQPAPEGLSGSDLVDWFEDRASLVVQTLTAADADANVWTFGPPRSVRFWLRRQALESALHCWDAQSAVGVPDPIDSALAADGIDEFLDIMLPRRLEQTPGSWNGETVHLHRTDGDGEWLLRLGPAGGLAVERSHGKGDAAVRGPASDLWLWLTNRVGADRLDTFGDSALLARWPVEVTF